jgi:hypothetical protein
MASNVYQDQAQYGPEKAVDEDDLTHWATDDGAKQAWLEVDPGKSYTISRAFRQTTTPSWKGFDYGLTKGPKPAKNTNGS